jgi:hypothetical protein
MNIEERFEEAVNFYNNKEYDKAVPLLEELANEGHAGAQLVFGVCYFDGVGLANDYVKAVEWLRKSAEQGNIRALGALGRCYYNGEGVTQDEDKGIELIRKAAEQGDEVAKQMLIEIKNEKKGGSFGRTVGAAIEGHRRGGLVGAAVGMILESERSGGKGCVGWCLRLLKPNWGCVIGAILGGIIAWIITSSSEVKDGTTVGTSLVFLVFLAIIGNIFWLIGIVKLKIHKGLGGRVGAIVGIVSGVLVGTTSYIINAGNEGLEAGLFISILGIIIFSFLYHFIWWLAKTIKLNIWGKVGSVAGYIALCIIWCIVSVVKKGEEGTGEFGVLLIIMLSPILFVFLGHSIGWIVKKIQKNK